MLTLSVAIASALTGCASTDEPRFELSLDTAAAPRAESTTTTSTGAGVACDPGAWPATLSGRPRAADPLAVGRPAPDLPRPTALLWHSGEGFHLRVYDSSPSPRRLSITVRSEGELVVIRTIDRGAGAPSVEPATAGTTISYEPLPRPSVLAGFDFAACRTGSLEIEVRRDGKPLPADRVLAGRDGRVDANPARFARG